MGKRQELDINGLHFANFTTQTFFVLSFCQALNFLVSIIIARQLGPAGKGTVTLLILYPTLLFTIGHLSIYRALTVDIGQKKYPLEYYSGTVLSVTIAVSFLLAGGFLFLYFFFNRLFIGGVPADLLFISLGILPALMLIQNYSSILQAKELIKQMNLVQLARVIFLLLAVVVSLLFCRLGISGTVYSYFISNLLATFIIIYFLKRISPGHWHFDLNLSKQLIKDGARLHMGVIANFVSLRIDMFILGYYHPSAVVGIYSIAVSLAELLIILPTSIQTVFYSKVAQILNDQEDLKRKTLIVYRHVFVLLLAFSLFFAFLAKPLIVLFFGNRFLSSYGPFLVLLPGVFFLWLNNTLIGYLVGIRRFYLVSLIATLAAILNVILNLIFIPAFGALGAAWSSAVTYSLFGFCSIFCFLRISKMTLKEFLKNLIFKMDDLNLYSMMIRKLFGFNS